MHPEADALARAVADDGGMSSTTRKRAVAVTAPLAAALLLVTLTGCADIKDTITRQASGEFATSADLAAQWNKQASWLPTDAVSIITRESTATDEASLTAVSESELDPQQCAEVERRSAPLFHIDGAPDVYEFDRAFACGEWSVVPTDDGWYGWTPNDSAEREQSPAS